MTLNEYQRSARSTAQYPKHMALPYVFLGLSGEAGEICNKYKKIIRDKNNKLEDEDVRQIQMELGDVMWYLAAAHDALGLEMEQTMALNLNKLSLRQKRGKIAGDGDER
ncbi:MAG: hypothetical protein EBR82_71495 [Caulobacteraceae bacterium]|nr:hypothetical protein [Caulobacteraceae bacterium]